MFQSTVVTQATQQMVEEAEEPSPFLSVGELDFDRELDEGD